MSKPYSGIPLEVRRAWIVPRWLKEAFVVFAFAAVIGVGLSKAVQHFGGRLERAKSAVGADDLNRAPPPLLLAARSGGQVDLARLRGHPVLVHFWATWCAPCRDELPLVEKISRRYDPSTLEVLAVSVDEGWDPVNKFLPAQSALPVVLDPGGKASIAWGTSKFPESYLVDRDGTIRLKFVGPRDWLDPNMAVLLEEFGAKPRS